MLRHAGKTPSAKTGQQRPAKALMAQIFGADILSTSSPGSKVGSPPDSLQSPAFSHSNATPIALVGSRPSGSTQNCSPKPTPPAGDEGACSGVSNTVDGAREPSDKDADNWEVAEVADAMNVAAQFAWPD